MPYTVIVLSAKSVVNVASVRRLSPFRYPGGKTWLVPRVVSWVKSFGKAPKFFFEPFAGGGIVGLTAAMEQLAEHVVLAELDDDFSIESVAMKNTHHAIMSELIVTKSSASVPANARLAAAKFLGRRLNETVSEYHQGELFA